MWIAVDLSLCHCHCQCVVKNELKTAVTAQLVRALAHVQSLWCCSAFFPLSLSIRSKWHVPGFARVHKHTKHKKHAEPNRRVSLVHAQNWTTTTSTTTPTPATHTKNNEIGGHRTNSMLSLSTELVRCLHIDYRLSFTFKCNNVTSQNEELMPIIPWNESVFRHLKLTIDAFGFTWVCVWCMAVDYPFYGRTTCTNRRYWHVCSDTYTHGSCGHRTRTSYVCRKDRRRKKERTDEVCTGRAN